MKITKDTVRYVAELARIGLTDKEISSLSTELDAILAYMDQLNKVNTDKTKPTSHVLEMENVYRQDANKPSLPVEEVLKNAPDKEDGFFKVPRVI